MNRRSKRKVKIKSRQRRRKSNFRSKRKVKKNSPDGGILNDIANFIFRNNPTSSSLPSMPVIEEKSEVTLTPSMAKEMYSIVLEEQIKVRDEMFNNEPELRKTCIIYIVGDYKRFNKVVSETEEDKLPRDYKIDLNNLQYMFQRMPPLKEDITVCRGISTNLKSLELNFKSVMSTSFDYFECEMFAKALAGLFGSVVLKINIPAGTKIIPIPSDHREVLINYKTDKLILDPDKPYIGRNNGIFLKIYYIYCKLVPKDTPLRMYDTVMGRYPTFYIYYSSYPAKTEKNQKILEQIVKPILANDYSYEIILSLPVYLKKLITDTGLSTDLISQPILFRRSDLTINTLDFTQPTYTVVDYSTEIGIYAGMYNKRPLLKAKL